MRFYLLPQAVLNPLIAYMINAYTDKREGYVALVTSLMFIVMISLIVFGFAAGILLGHKNTTALGNKLSSKYLTESCLDTARLKLAQNRAYTGNESIIVGSSTCYIYAITVQGGTKVIQASSTVLDATTVLKLIVASTTLSRVSFEEQ